MDLSIIIPVYNVQEYLRRCVLSCENQDFPKENYEIILVNDGSKDNSQFEAQKLETEFPNIKVISKENGGLSSARNAGLKIASGDYVWFVDSDDYIQNDCLMQIIDKCKQNNLDALAISKANVIDGITYEHYMFDKDKEETILSGLNALSKHLPANTCVPYTVYRRGFLSDNHLCFYEGIFHEDNEFSPKAYYLARRISCHNSICYYACERQNSIMTTINPKRSFDLIKVAESLSMFKKDVVKEKNNRVIFDNYISSYINASLELSSSFSDEIKNKLGNSFYENKALFKHLRSASRSKYKIEGFLFAIFPHHVVYIFNVLKKIK